MGAPLKAQVYTKHLHRHFSSACGHNSDEVVPTCQRSAYKLGRLELASAPEPPWHGRANFLSEAAGRSIFCSSALLRGVGCSRNSVHGGSSTNTIDYQNHHFVGSNRKPYIEIVGNLQMMVLVVNSMMGSLGLYRPNTLC